MNKAKNTLSYTKWLKVLLTLLLFLLVGCASENNINEEPPKIKTEEKEIENKKEDSSIDKSLFDGYILVDAASCDISGQRIANAVVDIGYGDREYWAFTNEYGQLVKVIAKEITLQEDAEATNDGRYCGDEAKVPGTEEADLDEGHVIADSLGGVSNAYNITPQNSTLNRHGDQAYMEKVIRQAGGCTDFEAIITYPNNETQIPSHYKYTYTINGNVIVDEFDNINPDDTILQNNTSNESVPQTAPQENMVWISSSGKKYHSKASCSGMKNPWQVTVDEAISQGKEPCKKCY